MQIRTVHLIRGTLGSSLMATVHVPAVLAPEDIEHKRLSIVVPPWKCQP